MSPGKQLEMSGNEIMHTGYCSKKYP